MRTYRKHDTDTRGQAQLVWNRDESADGTSDVIRQIFTRRPSRTLLISNSTNEITVETTAPTSAPTSAPSAPTPHPSACSCPK